MCVTTHGDWICTGSSSGHIHCFDRRHGKVLRCWKGHTKSVEYLKAISRHRLLSVSGDKTAVLWDMTKTPPQKNNSIYSELFVGTLESNLSLQLPYFCLFFIHRYSWKRICHEYNIPSVPGRWPSIHTRRQQQPPPVCRRWEKGSVHAHASRSQTRRPADGYVS